MGKHVVEIGVTEFRIEAVHHRRVDRLCGVDPGVTERLANAFDPDAFLESDGGCSMAKVMESNRS